MSDYLANLAAKSINQNQGIRFLRGELRPRVASRFELPVMGPAAWPEPPPLLEQITEQEAAMPATPAPPMAPVHRPHGGDVTQTAPSHHAGGDLHASVAAASITPSAYLPAGPGPQATGMRPPLRAVEEPTLPAEPEGSLGETVRPQEGETVSHWGEGSDPSRRVSYSPAMPPRSADADVAAPMPQPDTTRQRPPAAPRVGRIVQGEAVTAWPGAAYQEISRPAVDPAPPLETDPTAWSEPPDGQSDAHARWPAAPGNDRATAWRGLDRGPSDFAPAQSFAGAEPPAAGAAPVQDSAPWRMPTSDQNLAILRSVLARLGEPRTEPELSSSPTVNVTIGRVEVRATTASPGPAPKPRSAPVMTLDEYLQRRRNGGSS